MAKDNSKDQTKEEELTSKEKREKTKTNNLFNKALSQLNGIIGQTSLDLYGTDRTSDVDLLDKKFQNIIHTEINDLTNKNDEDITSFINRLYSQDQKDSVLDEMINDQFLAETGTDVARMRNFFYEQYKNKLLEQADLHQISTSLIELSEAISITRDAIISADVVEGRMSRIIEFDLNNEDDDNYIATVENIEEKFGLLTKIKNFIIPKTLEYGEYYIYTVPYSYIFKTFLKNKGKSYMHNGLMHEFTLTESAISKDSSPITNTNKKDPNLNTFIFKTYNDYKEANKNFIESAGNSAMPDLTEFSKDMETILSNISICNDPVPLPILEEGLNSISEFRDEFVNESGDKYMTEKSANPQSQEDLFDRNTSDGSEGITLKDAKDLDNIKDCYIKLIEPTKVIPIKIMDSVLGYYYVQEEEITPLSGSINNSLYFTKFDDGRDNKTIIDNLAERIVQSFNMKFLHDNLKFKKQIADSITYFDLSQKRIKFQFIPAEYMQVFKIDEDENGNGQSMLKRSLFYGKLYLMLLLFKIMSIILYSNDQKVNYVRNSGIDKNIVNKIQDIIRTKQSRQINMMDLFSYTTLINKIGQGAEMYVPVGRNGDRPMDTEILQGQDVQLNSDLLEMLKNGYILSTGVPAAILNYLNEADFAKQVEQNNTKFNGRVVNYQLDFNPSITEWYKKILTWSTNIPAAVIETFKFTLQPPKTVATNAKSESIQQFQTVMDFVVSLLYDDPQQSTDPNLPVSIKEFKKNLAADYLPMLNFERFEEIKKNADLYAQELSLKPNPSNGEDDLGDLEDLM